MEEAESSFVLQYSQKHSAVYAVSSHADCSYSQATPSHFVVEHFQE
jgi:hypothetical protein